MQMPWLRSPLMRLVFKQGQAFPTSTSSVEAALANEKKRIIRELEWEESQKKRRVADEGREWHGDEDLDISSLLPLKGPLVYEGGAATETEEVSGTARGSQEIQEPVKLKPRRLTAAQEHNERRERLLEAWSTVLKIDLKTSTVGRQMEACCSEEDARDTLMYSLFIKSTATLALRLTYLNPYVAWVSRNGGVGLEEGWPPKEDQMFNFLLKRIKEGASKSEAGKTLESMRFLHFVLGFDLGEVCESKRIQGKATQQITLMGKRKLSPELSREALQALEHKMADRDGDEIELFIIGAMLMLISLRSRFQDLQEVESVSSIGERIEVIAVSTKTSRGNDRLPIRLVGPKAMVTDLDWFESFIRFRSEINAPYPEFPLVPALGEDGWLKKQARLQDFNDGIRLVLSQVGFAKAREATSQGMKATLLSWACSFGISEPSRTALGYHVGKGQSSAVKVYSRDRLEAPMKELQDMMKAIRAGEFDPDSKIGKSWTKEGLEGGEEAEDDTDDEDQAEEENEEMSSMREALTAKATVALEKWNTSPGQRVVNLDTNKIHQVREDSGTKLKCGRVLSINYDVYDDEESKGGKQRVECKICFGKRKEEEESSSSSSSSDS